MSKTFMHGYAITPFAENKITVLEESKLDDTKNRLVLQMLTNEKLSQKQYQQFVVDFLNYTASIFHVSNITYECDPTLKHDSAESDLITKKMYFGKYLVEKPTNKHKFFDVLNTYIHELGHLEEIKDKKFDYQKFDNEQGLEFSSSINGCISWLANLFPQRQKNQIHHYAESLYLQYPWEIYARTKASEMFDEFLKTAQNLYKEKKLPKTPQVAENLKIMSDIAKDYHKYEHIAKKQSIPYLKQNSTSLAMTKQCFSGLIQEAKTMPHIPLEAIENIIMILSDKQLATQTDINSFFKTLLKQSLIEKEDLTSYKILKDTMMLISLSNNTESKQQLKTYYNFAHKLEKKHPNILSELHHTFLNIEDEYKPYFTIPPKYLEMEYQKYHTPEELKEYQAIRENDPRYDEDNDDYVEEMVI